jgi:hypothetical protein
MSFFHRIENLIVRWKILEHLCGISSMINVVIIVYKFLFGLELKIHVFNPPTQEFLIHSVTKRNYPHVWAFPDKYEILHILSSDGHPGGFYPLLPADISRCEFFGLNAFSKMLDMSSSEIYQFLRKVDRIDWGETFHYNISHNLPPLVKPETGFDAEPEEYNFQRLDQDTSWKDFEVLLDDLRKVDLFEEEYVRREQAKFEVECIEKLHNLKQSQSYLGLDSPSFTVSDSDNEYQVPDGFIPTYSDSPDTSLQTSQWYAMIWLILIWYNNFSQKGVFCAV